MSVVYNPRYEAPSEDNLNYIKSTYGGYNLCIVINVTTGSVIPNCVGYAWGRWREILGYNPKLSRGDGGSWWSYSSDGYSRSQTPTTYAVACWSGGSDGAGHVAIIEKVNEDGSIVVSDSVYGGARFRSYTIAKGYYKSGYTFQGFIVFPEDIIYPTPQPTGRTNNKFKWVLYARKIRSRNIVN